jgi:uncharacterized membrane protein YheB (UPF0754 family)
MLQVVVTLIVGAFIGWVTNYLAVLMLFRPHRERSILGIRFQGVFAKRQKALASKMGAVVSRELLSSEDIKAILVKASQSGDILKMLDQHIERVLLEKVPVVAPMLAFALSTDLVAKFKGLFMADVQAVVDGMIDQFGQKIDQEFDVHALVEQKISAFSSEKLEEILVEVMKREFQFIEWVGAVLGALIAAVQLIVLRCLSN